jgi:hypothetical protein
MSSHLDVYFAAEQAESLVFLLFGLFAAGFAVFALWRLRDPLFKGLAVPLLLVGLIQLVVGATVYLRTDAQRATLQAQAVAAPTQLKTEELARMETVRASLTVYKGIEAAFIVIGLILALNPKARRFWRGLGLGMLLQGALMLPADLLAEDRAAVYMQQLEAMP